MILIASSDDVLPGQQRVESAARRARLDKVVDDAITFRTASLPVGEWEISPRSRPL